MTANLYAGWSGILLGCIAGAIQGLWFDRADWLGGYGSWTRRVLRLGHISFFGIGIINLAFALSVSNFGIPATVWPARLLIAGAIAMPAVCYLSAAMERARRLFFIPVLCVISGLGIFLWELIRV